MRSSHWSSRLLRNPMKPFFVFDVESIGLHGEGYAVGGGVFFTDGTSDPGFEFTFAANPDLAEGDQSDRDWVRDNIPNLPITHPKPSLIRGHFWTLWLEAKKKYPSITMAAECGWPVEANFLARCVQDQKESRNWQGPYPLHEIASFMEAAGMDPMATYDRLPSEEPKHHPLGDAKQSARLLMQALV
jgi:hypothetical protein